MARKKKKTVSSGGAIVGLQSSTPPNQVQVRVPTSLTGIGGLGSISMRKTSILTAFPPNPVVIPETPNHYPHEMPEHGSQIVEEGQFKVHPQKVGDHGGLSQGG